MVTPAGQVAWQVEVDLSRMRGEVQLAQMSGSSVQVRQLESQGVQMSRRST
jgi:hypothetical protein